MNGRRVRRTTGLVIWIGLVGLGGWPAGAQEPSEAATQQYAVAVGLQNQKLYDLAVEEWQAFLKKFPDDPRQARARHYLGTCQLQAGNLDQAVAAFREVLEKHPKFEMLDASLLNLGVAHYNLAQKSGRSEDYERGAQAFAQLVEKAPKSEHAPQAKFYRGECLYHQGKQAEAVTAYAALIRDHPQSPLVADAFYASGVAQEAIKQPDRATASYAEFIKRFPRHALAGEVRMRQAEIAFAAGKFADAQGLFAQATALEGFKLADLALLRQARSLYELGRHAEAGERYWDVPRRFPKTSHYDTAVLAGGKCFYLAGKYERAREGLGLVAAREVAEAAEAAHWIARSWLKEKKPLVALEVLDKAVARHAGSPALPQLLLARADALYEIPDRRPETVAIYAEFAEKQPGDALAPQARYMAALAALGLGRHDTAQGESEKFLARWPDHELAPDVLLISGEALLVRGSHDAAAARYRQLLERFPKHSSAEQARVRLGLALVLQKKHAEAVAALTPAAGSRDPATQAEALYLIGRGQSELGKLNEAAAALERSLVAQPDRPQADEALLALAHCYRQLGRKADAAAKLTHLTTAYPKSAHLDEAYYRLGEYAYADAQLDPAIEHYSRVLRDWPQGAFAAHAIYGTGWARFDKQQWSGAAEAMSQLVGRHPNSELVPRARYVRAMAHQQLGQFEPALADLNAFIASKPNQADLLDALYVLGLCQSGLKRHQEAVRTFQSVLKTDPGYAAADKVYYEMAWALKELGQHQESVDAFAKLVASKPDSPLAGESLFRVAEAHYDAGRFADAARVYGDANQKAAGSELGEKALHKLAWSRLKLGEHEKAAETFEEQLKAFPRGELAPDATFLVGECHFKRRAWKPALEWFGRVIAAKNPSHHALALHRSGECHGALEQWPASADFYGKVLEQFPDFEQRPEARYGLAWAIQNQGKLDEAIALYEKVTEETNTETAAKARFMVGECLFAQKKHKEAIKNFLKAAYGYGHEEWAALGHFEAGRCFEVLKDIPQAIQSYRTVIEKYPKSRRVPEARQRLAELEGS